MTIKFKVTDKKTGEDYSIAPAKKNTIPAAFLDVDKNLKVSNVGYHADRFEDTLPKK